MKRIIWILVIAALGWYAFGKYQDHLRAGRAAEAASQSSKKKVVPASSKAGESGVSFFTCDGRNSCVQMTSCEEARYFVKNCGMNSGASGEGASSCEKQWCK